MLGEGEVELLAYPKAMVVAEKLVTALQRGRASTRWRDFADLLLITRGALDPVEVIDALVAVSAHRAMALRPVAEALTGMPEVAQARWETWLTRQGAPDVVPRDFQVLLDRLDQVTRPWVEAAARAR